ncbi:YihY/virulence factor BrkB family protein [Erythrobacteraceae bacterium CFH 75059]|uniref:YihY/virulence factor BrkB family protein n=1 Tax=Qipengyuania thermophila TaxID=2509361 RepID=UPI00101ECFB1|nr:YihY/virulence factor BrkB family protein [Qipengyuania thermophila]TCD05007.1 YihY/virulence factor BrkB family protein [Erythrobacteraceae bacterium CFH 75059]
MPSTAVPPQSTTSSADRGRSAGSPWQIPWSGWKEILKRTYKEIGEDRVSLVAAGVAFYALLALFPALTSLLSVAGLILDPLRVVDQLAEWTANLPEAAAQIIQSQGASVASGADGALSLAALAGLALALYGAAKGTKTLMEGMNIAYDEDEKRGFLVLNIVALGLTALMVVAVLLAAGLGIVVPLVVDGLGLPPVLATVLNLLRWVVLAAIAVLGLSLLYRFGPSRENAKWRWITPGSAIAVALWVVGTGLFSIYVQNFGNYNETYGALGGVIILLTWLWLSAFIVLLGAELNSEIEHQTMRDTTTGPEEPMGERGAVKADSVAAGDEPQDGADHPLQTQGKHRARGH